MRRRGFVVVLVLGLALLLSVGAACGDDDGDDDAEAPTATVEAPQDGTEEPDEEPTEAPEAPDGAASPFDSFHYTVDISMTIDDPEEGEQSLIDASVEGDFVAPDSHAFTTRFEFAGIGASQEAVIIGEDAWIREGSGDWTATSRSSGEIEDAIDLTSADPDFLQDPGFVEDIQALDSEPETINGVDTRRYHISRESVEALSDLLGEDFLGDAAGIEDLEMTVWLEEESNALVRAELSATASSDLLGDGTGFGIPEDASVSLSMQVDVTQINDEGIEIEAPI